MWQEQRERTFIPASSRARAPEPDFFRSHYNQWEDVSVIKAMSAVEGVMSIQHASELYGVPKSDYHLFMTECQV